MLVLQRGNHRQEFGKPFRLLLGATEREGKRFKLGRAHLMGCGKFLIGSGQAVRVSKVRKVVRFVGKYKLIFTSGVDLPGKSFISL
jgi:hypothetical protein